MIYDLCRDSDTFHINHCALKLIFFPVRDDSFDDFVSEMAMLFPS